MRRSPGAAGGGEHWPEYRPGGGEGAQGQCQRARTDALPGGGSALLVTFTLTEVTFAFFFLFPRGDANTSCTSSSGPQYSPASCSAKVFGPVHRGHSLPAGNGVLPPGEFGT